MATGECSEQMKDREQSGRKLCIGSSQPWSWCWEATRRRDNCGCVLSTPVLPDPTRPSPHPSAVTHAPGSTPAWKECLTSVLAWLASPRIMPFPFPGNMTFFGNRAIAAVTSYSEVTLEQGRPLIQYDWCPYSNRRNTERDTGRR